MKWREYVASQRIWWPNGEWTYREFVVERVGPMFKVFSNKKIEGMPTVYDLDVRWYFGWRGADIEFNKRIMAARKERNA